MIPGHPHTVRTTPIPLYMRGIGRLWHLGQDDPTIYDPSGDLIPPSSSDPGSVFLPSLPAPIVAPGSIDPSMYDPNAPLIAPTSGLSEQDQALAQLYQSSVAAGTMTPAQATSAIAQLMTAGAATAKAAQGLTTAPSPRVALPAIPGKTGSILTSETIVAGVPDLLFLVLGGVAIFAFGGGK